MLEKIDWWGTWAPFWEHMENQHFSTHVTEDLIEEINSPVLIIGAGMGLIVDFLKKKGYEATGIDLDETMIKMAKEKRDLDLIHADARELPFQNKQFETVIISSGVVDYIDDIQLTTSIMNESLRVLKPYGNLFVSFYQTTPIVEKINKRIGIINNNKYHIKRLFEISETVQDSPLKCVKKITQWTDKSYIPTLFYWIKLGMFLPLEMKEYQKKTDLIFEEAERNNVNRSILINTVPDNVPYREEQDIKSLLNDLGFYYNKIKRYPDCIIAKYHKSSLLFSQNSHSSQKKSDKNKDWAIITENITKKYKKAKVNAVEALNIKIEKGTIHGILGPNGAGKTTTLSMLCGLLKPNSGKIYFPHHMEKNDLKKHIGYVPQDLALFPGLTAIENLNFFGKLYGLKGKHLFQKVLELLEIVGLCDRSKDIVENYSTGMMRRLNLAAGLMHDPEIILLDEPTVGIDPQSRNCIFDAVLKLRKKGVTILYTTHYMEEAMKLCDRVSIMDHGRIILEDNPKYAVENFGLHQIEFASESNADILLKELEKDPSIFYASIFDDIISIYMKSQNKTLEKIEEIHKIAERYNINLILKHIHEPNLESLFLDITGKSLRD